MKKALLVLGLLVSCTAQAADVDVVDNIITSTKWTADNVYHLKNIIYDVTDTIVGLENMEMVMSRGKAITFNTGQ